MHRINVIIAKFITTYLYCKVNCHVGVNTPPRKDTSSSRGGRQSDVVIHKTNKIIYSAILLSMIFMPNALFATGDFEYAISVQYLNLLYAVPFAGLLLSLALMPVLASKIWHKHYGKISCMWAALLLIPLLITQDKTIVFHDIMGTIIHHYIPFVAILAALYSVTGGIKIDVHGVATPGKNTTILAIGTLIAGWIGTTGASMLLIRPILRLNKGRKDIKHLVVFFIFLVSNIGGSATPLGDPPLFLGFLNGVDFFWTLRYLMPETIMMAVPLLIIFHLWDSYVFYKETGGIVRTRKKFKYSIGGKINFLFLGAIVGLVLMSGLCDFGIHIPIFGIDVTIENFTRDIGLFAITAIAWKASSDEVHKANSYNWAPMIEVAELFAAIFITVIPVSIMLNAGLNGPFQGLVDLVTDGNGNPINYIYFWMTGILSAFLDNAPTYLIFFNLAGGDADVLMTTLSKTLEAISLGAVFMGAVTYIGNAPNFMVKSIAEHSKVHVPSFLGYLWWSFGILGPLLFILTMIEF